jgi:hypothetical protein
MKKPYIKRYNTFKGYTIWIVDGKYIRDKINEEFTNYGFNFRFKFIPNNEFWIDKEYGKGNEIKYYLKNLLVESNLIKKGVSFERAIHIANNIEKKERLKHEKLLKKFNNSKKILDKIHMQLLKRYSKKINVWIINGRLVRDYFFIDFTEGGHDLVYNFIPEKEIWIEEDLRRNERRFVLLHELHERNLMSNGINYESAHKSASMIERECRKNPKIFFKKIKEELDKIKN